MKGMTLFSGFGGADIGMTAAGIEIVAGIEYDAAIAEVARANGHPVTVADVRHVNPADYIGIEALHASPVCTRASVANNSAERDEETGLKEAALDIECAQATANFITALRPKIFTLENVWGYRKFKSWRLISDTLDRLGYWWTIDHVNAADFGVPQTRRRMIVRAIKGGWVPPLPEPEPWVGWYEAIEDLIPTLPESKFAEQLARLPTELKTVIIGGANRSASFLKFALEHRKSVPGVVDPDEPLFTVASTSSSDIRAFLVNTNQSGDDGDTIRIADVDRPAFTTTPSADGRMRAFLVPGGNANSFSIRNDDEPARTVEDVNRVGNILRAFLCFPIDGLTRDGDEPAQTVVSSAKTVEPRAFLVNGDNASRDVSVVNSDDPSFTVRNGDKTTTRAWLSQGRVVKMTPRALARFQTFPDSYMLPDKAALACKGIGNACCPLLFEKLYKQLLDSLD